MSVSRSIGSLVVRIVADGLGRYKAEMNALGDATEKAASKIDKSAKAAGAAAAQMGGGVAQAADAAQALNAGAGVAGVGVAAFAVIRGRGYRMPPTKAQKSSWNTRKGLDP